MLNMSSAPAPGLPEEGDDRTARARIRDAAITLFAALGVTAASVRAIATEAGVSPALVIHHFGSKDGLRAACDEHVAATIRQRKGAAMAAGPGLDPVAAIRLGQDGPPLMAYLARTLIDGTPQVAALVDEMVADAASYMAQGVQTGVLHPTEHPYERAVVLTMWSLGALVLHEHLRRLLGVDLTGPPDELAAATAYFAAGLEVLSDGVVTPEAATRMKTAFAQAGARPTEEKETGS